MGIMSAVIATEADVSQRLSMLVFSIVLTHQ